MKKIKIILYIILIGTCFSYLIQSTYSKYRKSLEGDLNSSMAKWNIKVNDELITNKSKLTNNITPTFEKNKYSKDGVIAPSVEAYYDIIIDSKNTDYKFNYNIISKVSKNSDVTDLITTKYIIDPDNNNEATTYDEKTGIVGTIDKPTTLKLRIYIKWNDDYTNTMDNKKDTEVALNKNSKSLMEVKISFEQKNNDD